MDDVGGNRPERETRAYVERGVEHHPERTGANDPVPVDLLFGRQVAAVARRDHGDLVALAGELAHEASDVGFHAPRVRVEERRDLDDPHGRG